MHTKKAVDINKKFWRISVELADYVVNTYDFMKSAFAKGRAISM